MTPSRSLIASTAVAAIVGVIGLAYAETSPTFASDDAAAPGNATAAASTATMRQADMEKPAERP